MLIKDNDNADGTNESATQPLLHDGQAGCCSCIIL